MPHTFNVTEMTPEHYSNAQFRVVKDDLPDVEMFFKKATTVDLDTRDADRAFDLVAIQFGICHFVTQGTCNHVPTINMMQELSDPKLVEIREAKERVEAAREALDAAQREVDVLEGRR